MESWHKGHMIESPGAAVWLRGASQLRRRWRSWLGLALLIGLAGGLIVASVAGARRTTSTYDRLLEPARPFDVVLGVGCPEELQEQPDECAASAATAIEAILQLPPVADGALGHGYILPVLDDDGFSIQPQDEALGVSGEPPGETCFSGNGGVEVFGSPSGRLGTDLNRHRFVAGRAADPARADEAVMSVATARRAGVSVGDTLRIFAVDACEFVPQEEWPEAVEVTVVGLQVSPGEVQPETGRYLQSVTVTPPLLEQLESTMGRTQSGLMVVLREGATAAELLAAVESAGIPAEVGLIQDDFTADVRRGLRPDALTLWLLAALGGVASVIVLGQALLRQVWAEADELPALRAMGFTGRDLALVGAVEGVAVAVAGGVVTVALAVAASPLFPIGRARNAEPEPGVRIDLWAVGLGGLVVTAASLAVVVAASRWVAARASAAHGPAAHPPRVPVWLARLGARPSAVVGARMALDRGKGSHSVPVRTGFAGIAVGAAALAGSLTFGADLEHLLETPRLVGWNWDVAFLGGLELPEPDLAADPVDDPDPLAVTEDVIRQALAIEGVERAGFLTLFPPNEVPLIEELPDLWPLSFSSGPGAIGPTVTSGRAPAGPDEILVTRTVLEELGLQVGDPLQVHGVRLTDVGETAPTTSTVTIVGTGVLPMGDGVFEHTVALTFDGLNDLAPGAEPQGFVVDLAPGADRQRTIAALEELGLRDPVGADEVNVTALVDLDVQSADNLPRLLGALMALLALGVLIHLVYTGVRAGRHELATLRALGFSRAQVITSIAWQTTIVVAAPFALAAVVGAAIGRVLWLIYAERLSVAPETVTGWRPIAAFFLVFLVIANVLGVVIGRRARRSPPSEVLRTE